MKRSSSSGQAALILIMIMAVVGAVSVGVASRSVENLRSSEIETTSSQSFLAAESALELALQAKGNVSTTNYSATYTPFGSDGFISDQVDEGDVVQTTLVGAVGVTALNVYWNSNSSVKVGVLSGNAASGYSVKYYTAEPDAARATNNKFSASTTGVFNFKTTGFNNKLIIPIDLAAAQPPKLVRINVLYQKSSIGIEPVGGILAGQAVTINAVGTAQSNVTTNLVFSKFSDRVPVVFDNVLFTNGSLSQ